MIISLALSIKKSCNSNSLLLANVEALSLPETETTIPKSSEPLDDGIVRCDGDPIYLYRTILVSSEIVYQHMMDSIDREYVVHMSECVAEGPNSGGKLVGNNMNAGLDIDNLGYVKCLPNRCNKSFGFNK